MAAWVPGLLRNSATVALPPLDAPGAIWRALAGSQVGGVIVTSSGDVSIIERWCF
jgi:hypothetical protein